MLRAGLGSANNGICSGNISVSEYQGLESLFVSTQGVSWNWDLSLPTTTQWNFPKPSTSGSGITNLDAPCGDLWQGLQCSYFPVSQNNSCSIVSISLVNMNLLGTLPSNISKLFNIQVNSIDVG